MSHWLCGKLVDTLNLIFLGLMFPVTFKNVRSSEIVPSAIMNLEEMPALEKSNIQSNFYSIVHLSVYWNLTLESIRNHHEMMPFSFPKSPNKLRKLQWDLQMSETPNIIYSKCSNIWN